MTYHLFGNILTFYGVAANNHGETQGNITTLKKLLWKGETHTKVSSEAIRWAIRYYWQKTGCPVNRVWNDRDNDYEFQDPSFNSLDFIDDDILGFFETEKAKKEVSKYPEAKTEENSSNITKKKTKNKKEEQSTEINESSSEDKEETASSKRGGKSKGSFILRRGTLDVTRAVSTRPYNGEISFNARSGNKKSTSLYATEFQATRYQFGFGITPEHCQDCSRILELLDALVLIHRVGGNQGRFLFDFAPESLILRWTHDFAPRFLYCFEEDEFTNVSIPELLRQIRSGDLDPQEFWIGGKIVENLPENLGVNRFPGIKATVNDLKQRIGADLQFCLLDNANREEN